MLFRHDCANKFAFPLPSSHPFRLNCSLLYDLLYWLAASVVSCEAEVGVTKTMQQSISIQTGQISSGRKNPALLIAPATWCPLHSATPVTSDNILQRVNKFVAELSCVYISPVVSSFLLPAHLCLIVLYSDGNLK